MYGVPLHTYIVALCTLFYVQCASTYLYCSSMYTVLCSVCLHISTNIRCASTHSTPCIEYTVCLHNTHTYSVPLLWLCSGIQRMIVSVEGFDPNRQYSFLCQCAIKPFRRIPLLISSTGQCSELSVSADKVLAGLLKSVNNSCFEPLMGGFTLCV